MLLDNFWNREQGKIIRGARIYIRHPILDDWRQWSDLRAASRQHLTPWEPIWASDTLSKRSFKNRLRKYSNDAKADNGYAFFLFNQETDQLLGSITLSNVRRGVAQMGTIGYWTGLPFARQGYMLEGLGVVLPHLFDRYALRRIEAACLPENIPSASLLEKAGFTREGYAREYLCINGTWHDHLLFALLKGDRVSRENVNKNGSGVTCLSG